MKMMKNNKSGIFLAVAVLLVILAGAWFFWDKSPGTSPVQPKDQPVQQDKAAQIVSKMSAEERVGQLLMIGLAGTTVDDAAQRQLEYCHAGNVILFDRNMDTPAQVQHLNKKIDASIRKRSGILPFIAVDQEGGQVLRMKKAFPPVPSEEAIGQGGQPDQAKEWAVTTGRELKKLGFNLNFAPVVDLGDAAQRSYSTEPDLVTAFGQQAVEGYAETGIWCSLKHFPGIGKVKTDPHIDGDSVDVPKEQLETEDLKPFASLIKSEDNSKMFIMVSNVTFPALDANLPACVSKAVMTDLLRNTYGYRGLIISDDMEMGAMAKHYAFSEMGVMAVKAGADMVLVCHEYPHERETYDGLLKAYKSDPSFKKLVDEKVTHIVRVKLQQT